MNNFLFTVEGTRVISSPAGNAPEKLQLYQADRAMPVRGLLATKLRFGIKLAALNFKKLSAYLDSLDQCALLSANS